MIRIILCKTVEFKQRGMTLIELILVVAIIGILASIVYPNYSDHIRKAHRKQAMVDMARIQLHLEKHYDNGYSTDDILANGKCTDFCNVADDRYEITVTADSHGYMITATPKADKSQNNDSCLGTAYTKLTLSHSGAHTPVECWQ